ncbi:NADH-quinone oxidoreductase subunit N [Candidatus Sumerlaeota bacterium]|nr:NADH-quinone oxidoreductase subunit N [Candidatus Sumerlaeota bacterium]
MQWTSGIIEQLPRDLSTIAPEIALVITILALILIDLLMRGEVSFSISFFAIIGVFISLHLLFNAFYNPAPSRTAFWGLLAVDKFTLFLKLIFLLSTFLVILLTLQSNLIYPYRVGEYYTLLLTATMAMCFLVSARNFILFYLALETLSISSYVLATYTKRDVFSTEAGLKYLIYGAAASAVMLFGISYLYGLTGTLDITAWVNVLTPVTSLTVLLALLLVFVGIAFKISAVPFHFWAPDVYQGAPTPITAYLSVASKIAGFGALFRVSLPLFTDLIIPGSKKILLMLGPYHFQFATFFWIISVITMTFGNLVALRQNNLKRLLAYSSIAHAGYILMGMTVLDAAALKAMLFYFLIYMFMNIGAFYCAIVLENKTRIGDITHYKGIVNEYPYLVVGFGVILFSLTGIPPFGGFIGKYLLFAAVVNKALSTPHAMFYFSLAIIGVLNSVISLYYYVRILKIMVLESPAKKIGVPWTPVESLLIAIFVIAIFYLFVLWTQPYVLIENVVKSIIV